MNDGGGFIFIDCDGRTGYINPFTGEECYVKFMIMNCKAYDREGSRETS
jgi:hypothetical protein